MLAGQIHQPRSIRLVDAPQPSLTVDPPGARGRILFQVELACLCGSDMFYFDADYEGRRPQVGHSLHEMIGTVLETTGRRFKPGDRVLCVPTDQRGLWERFIEDERWAVPLDPRLTDEQAVLAQPLGTVLYALRKLPNVLDLNVAVVGQGPIGLLFDAALRNLGARWIIGIDPLPQRLAVAARMGATATIDPARQDPIEAVRELTGGAMADLVVEAVGHREMALNLCFDLARHAGQVLAFGAPPATLDGVEWAKAYRKNLSIQTSVDPDFERDFPLAMRWIAEGRIDVKPLVTHRLPLAQVQRAFELYRDRLDGSLKVFIEFPTHTCRG